MTHLALTDCIQATPARTLVALSRELSSRARRSLGRHAGRAVMPASDTALADVSPAPKQVGPDQVRTDRR